MQEVQLLKPVTCQKTVAATGFFSWLTIGLLEINSWAFI